MSEPLLVVDEVSVRFGGLQALEAVSFDVERGEILALIGPNGAGKSTLLNVVSGALVPDRGSVRFDGEQLVGRPAHAVNRMGLVRTFQGAEILRRMSVRENVIAAGVARSGAIGIAFGLIGAGPARTAIARLRTEASRHLDVVGLGDLADASAATLTAGQQRLLAIARALGTGAELLILDEPGAGLNTLEKALLAEVIRKLRADGKTIVFVEHDLGLVGALAERMVVLDHGRVIATGRQDVVRKDPKVLEAYLGNTEIASDRPRAAIDPNPGELLVIDALTVSYGGARALDNVSITVAPGEIVSIVGANGAGKSTLLKAVAGMVAPTSGRLRFDNAEIVDLAAADRVVRGLSLAPEGRQLFGALSVKDNLVIGRYGRRRAAGVRELIRASERERRHEAEALEHVYAFFPKLQERALQSAGTLSGGEGQMLAIGRALMNQPKLLMLDEPSFGLAPQIAREILEALPRLSDAGIAILLVEQNARAALRVSTRAYILATGKVVAEGLSANLLADVNIARTYLGWEEKTEATAADLVQYPETQPGSNTAVLAALGMAPLGQPSLNQPSRNNLP